MENKMEINFPPVRLDFNDDGNVSSDIVFRISHSVDATNIGGILPKDDVRLTSFVEEFRKNNPHLMIESVDYWGDGDNGTYEHFVDIFYKTYPWYDEIINKNIKIVINEKDYYIMWFCPDGLRVMDSETKETYFLNKQTLELKKW